MEEVANSVARFKVKPSLARVKPSRLRPDGSMITVKSKEKIVKTGKKKALGFESIYENYGY
jgi:hypothetical protein